MSLNYKAVGWNRQKKIYDRTLLGSVALYLVVFIGLHAVLHPQSTAETMVIRAFGTGALLLLHIILSVGPLCRLDPRFLPLLYNRRHMGVLQAETSPVFSVALGVGLVWVVGVHVIAACKEVELDRGLKQNREDVEVCGVDDIAEKRGKIFCLSGERIAVFKYDGKVSAISNVCQHQNGPLGEGQIIDGLVTCPWHGFQYDPTDGSSPPPFTEKVPTFNVRIENRRIFVDPKPNPPGTQVNPAHVKG